uniref:hypothetical protein n=1 Tax=Pseudomonas viridiflava TaxID=33069 RepID=UPI0019809AC6
IRHGPQVKSFSTGQAAQYSGLRLRALSVPSLQLPSQKLCSGQPEAQSSSLLMTMEIIKSCGDIPQFAPRPSATAYKMSASFRQSVVC